MTVGAWFGHAPSKVELHSWARTRRAPARSPKTMGRRAYSVRNVFNQAQADQIATCPVREGTKACGALADPGKQRTRDLAVPGSKWGWAFATRSSPVAHHLALSLSRAGCSPTPLNAACADLGLMAGPSRPLPAGICRVRPLRPVRSPPAGGGSPDGVQTRLQSVHLFVSAP
jgi:hypothetical protein